MKDIFRKHTHLSTEQILQCTSDAFVSLDYNWRYTYVNNQALNLMKKQAVELIGHTLLEVFPDMKGTIFEEKYNKTMYRREAVSFEAYYDAYNMWLNVNTYPCDGGIFIFYSDITDRVMMRQELQNNDEWLSKLVDHLPTMVWASDENKKCRFFNSTWLAFTGHKAIKHESGCLLDYVHENDKGRVTAAYNEAFDVRAPFRIEYLMKYNDGTYRVVSDTAIPLYISGNIFAGYIGSVIDIHDRIIAYREMEENIREKTLELTNSLGKEKELNKMKSDFLSMASHQFRTPLSTVLSSTGLIEQYIKNFQPLQIERHVDRVRSSVKSLIQLLDDFLSLDKLEQGQVKSEKRAFDLYNFICEITDSLDNSLKNGQGIYYSYTGSKVVCTEPNMLNNIMLNLLSNAIKYSNDDITLDVETNGQLITISVSDKGIGIPPEEQEKLFSKHFRASNVGNIKGTGLGLNIVQHYIQLLNGSIKVNSKHDGGTTFTVQIPNEKI